MGQSPSITHVSSRQSGGGWRATSRPAGSRATRSTLVQSPSVMTLWSLNGPGSSDIDSPGSALPGIRTFSPSTIAAKVRTRLVRFSPRTDWPNLGSSHADSAEITSVSTSARPTAGRRMGRRIGRTPQMVSTRWLVERTGNGDLAVLPGVRKGRASVPESVASAGEGAGARPYPGSPENERQTSLYSPSIVSPSPSPSPSPSGAAPLAPVPSVGPSDAGVASA